MDTKAMQSAASPLPNNAPPVGRNEIMQVKSGPRGWLGSCNACVAAVYRVDEDGNEQVTEIQFRGLNFRLCLGCRVQLKGML